MTYMVQLFEGRHVSLATYARGWKLAKAADPTMVCKDGPGSWALMPVSQVLRELRRGMHERINRHIRWYGRGRKWDTLWQIETARTVRAVNTPRLVVRWVPPEFRERLAHRLTHPDDV